MCVSERKREIGEEALVVLGPGAMPSGSHSIYAIDQCVCIYVCVEREGRGGGGRVGAGPVSETVGGRPV